MRRAGFEPTSRAFFLIDGRLALNIRVLDQSRLKAGWTIGATATFINNAT